ncbi:hypothetical protein TL16_g12721 [Triparma laevis f. inornata]|uniref:Uncharacterized protein n=1 Tax=Triparma laevis f. inornata TaxID=1714386 RepID=A0A9W7BU38_9STRA|nr:hypothetical protein TL16_g12721 [Triparma laevis f. inornata]
MPSNSAPPTSSPSATGSASTASLSSSDTSPFTPEFINSSLTSLCVIAIAGLGGYASGLGLVSRRAGTSKTAKVALKHLPLQWSIRCATFATLYEGGKSITSFTRENLKGSYFPTPKAYEDYVRLIGKLIDCSFAGGLAGLVGANIGRTMFADGDKLLRVGSVKKLSLGFMVSRGVLCGFGAGGFEVGGEEIERRWLREEEGEVEEDGEEVEVLMEERGEVKELKKSGEELMNELTYYRKLLGREKND